MVKKPKYWTGDAPSNCDICNRAIIDKFVDGRTSDGPWANMCMKCFRLHGSGLGVGNGQQYELQAESQWLKTKG